MTKSRKTQPAPAAKPARQPEPAARYEFEICDCDDPDCTMVYITLYNIANEPISSMLLSTTRTEDCRDVYDMADQLIYVSQKKAAHHALVVLDNDQDRRANPLPTVTVH